MKYPRVINITSLNRGKLYCWVLLATIIKVFIIMLTYQKLVVVEGGTANIAPYYGWYELIGNMRVGRYEMNSQPGLEGIVDMNNKAGRPPVYAMLLYGFTLCGRAAPTIAVAVQSAITSAVAILGCELALLAGAPPIGALVCTILLFLLPMNFLKSGSIDEAPLMLVFILGALLMLLAIYMRKVSIWLLPIAGVLLGLATLTRLTTNMMFFLAIVWLGAFLKSWPRKLIGMALLAVAYYAIIFPWLVYVAGFYGKYSLTADTGRYVYISTSEEFIQYFPEMSIDNIERKAMRRASNEMPYLSEMDYVRMSDTLGKIAVNQIIKEPIRLWRSFMAKIRTFVPLNYYPPVVGLLHRCCFLISYYFAICWFLWSLRRIRERPASLIMVLLAIMGSCATGFILFLGSRHLYVPIVLMIIFSCCAIGAKNSASKLDDQKIMHLGTDAKTV